MAKRMTKMGSMASNLIAQEWAAKAEREKAAAEACKPLVWSSEPPKVPGWYWVTATAEAKFVAVVMQIYSVEYGETLKREAPDALFAGPIPEPSEPAPDAR